jgi:hypothetical protein
MAFRNRFGSENKIIAHGLFTLKKEKLNTKTANAFFMTRNEIKQWISLGIIQLTRHIQLLQK